MPGISAVINGRKGGRPKGTKARHTIQAEKAREFIIKKIAEDLEPIIQAQQEAAKGMYVEKKMKNGKTIIYQKEPELRTGEYLLNQIAGKPRETLDVGIHKDIDADF